MPQLTDEQIRNNNRFVTVRNHRAQSEQVGRIGYFTEHRYFAVLQGTAQPSGPVSPSSSRLADIVFSNISAYTRTAVHW